MKLKIKKLQENAKLPNRANTSDSGLDIYSIENVIIPVGEMKSIHTGIAIQLPKPVEITIFPTEPDVSYRQTLIWECQVRPKSGLAKKHGITVLNSPGTIDCFSENMKIKTIDGNKIINELSINEVVLSVNEDTMEIEKDTIDAIIDKGKLEVFIIETEDGILEITKNTPVYTDEGIKYITELKKDDKILVF